MDWRQIRRSLGVVGVAVLVLVAGLFTGSYLGRYRAEASRAQKKVDLQGLLEQNLRGIEIGLPFPDVPLWSPDGMRAYRPHDLVSQGGVVFYVLSTCESCVDAVEAIHSAIGSMPDSGRDVVLICSPNPGELVNAMTEREIDLTLYCDVEDLFSREFNISTTRTYFVLGENGVVKRMGTAGFDPDEYVAVLSKE